MSGMNIGRSIIAVMLAVAIIGSAVQSRAQQLSPAEAAIQVTTVINQLAQLATNQQRTIEAQQKQIADLQKQLADKTPQPQK